MLLWRGAVQDEAAHPSLQAALWKLRPDLDRRGLKPLMIFANVNHIEMVKLFQQDPN